MKKLLFIIAATILLSCSKDDPIQLTAPIATEATDISNDVFVANWEAVNNANNYELQISTANDFSTNLIVYDNLPSSIFNFAVNQVNHNTEYFYRVRASSNDGTVSDFSNIVSLFTLPDSPVAIDATDVTNNSFTANWSSVDGINEYKVFVSLNNPPEFGGQILSNYNGVVVNGNSLNITGLQFNTVYHYQIKAVSEDRESDYSNNIPVLTL